jgi:hypothetical protein
MSIARLYAGAGRVEDALDWLERGVELREPNSPYISVATDFGPLRSEPRFQGPVGADRGSGWWWLIATRELTELEGTHDPLNPIRSLGCFAGFG